MDEHFGMWRIFCFALVKNANNSYKTDFRTMNMNNNIY